MMRPYQVSLNYIKILNIIFFQILEVKTFIQFYLPCALLSELLTWKSCFVSELNKNAPDLHELAIGSKLFWDLAVSNLNLQTTYYLKRILD